MKKFYEWLGKAEMTVAKVCLLVLCTLVFVAAVARTLGHPMSWTVDMATFLFAWSVFLGADTAMRKDMLVSIDLVVCRFPDKIQKYIKLLNNVIIFIFLIVMVVYGSYLSYTTYNRSFNGLPWLSYTWVTISVPIGCLLMLTTNVVKTKELLIKGRPGK
ncbi:MAG: tripartite tricarboxylate transporter family receptor [Bacillota bacterium]|jgi:TRAP-type C4-dicarboxylate transport system permease small subunit|nr:tripartite tricarboxylate transporter family receptor [Bacillota bacterium]